MGARIAGVCALVIVVIAASALLFSGGGFTLPAASDSPGYAEDYREYFSEYYDSTGAASSWESSLPRAETGTGVTVELTPNPGGEALSLSEVYDKCSDSVVAITSLAGEGQYIWGSGIIMTPDGYILTNAHVLEGATESTVTLWDDREYTASLVGVDSASDLAVIKIDVAALPAAGSVDACAWCDYRAVCGHEPDSPVRRIAEKDADEVWKELVPKTAD